MRAPDASLAGDLLAGLDPVTFARRWGVIPDPWQEDILRSGDRRILMNCSRQSGKSTVAALTALHTAIYHPSSLILLVSPSSRQSGELFRAVAKLHAASRSPPPKEASSLRLELMNGSRIVSLPGSEATIWGYSGVNLLIIDEAARVEDELYHSVTPMLATTKGRLIALSTPWGRRGWWSDAWHGRQLWKRVMVPATECPRISPEFLDQQRESMGDWWFRQEFLCEFVDAESSVFRSADIAALFDDPAELWDL